MSTRLAFLPILQNFQLSFATVLRISSLKLVSCQRSILTLETQQKQQTREGRIAIPDSNQRPNPGRGKARSRKNERGRPGRGRRRRSQGGRRRLRPWRFGIRERAIHWIAPGGHPAVPPSSMKPPIWRSRVSVGGRPRTR